MDDRIARFWKLIAAGSTLLLLTLAAGAEEAAQREGSTYLTIDSTLSFDLRVGVEHRWPAGPGIVAAAGVNFLSFAGGGVVLTGEALGILPLFAIGKTAGLELALGMPDLMWVSSESSLMTALGAAARLRMDLGDRWALLARVGTAYPLIFEPAGFRSGSNLLFGLQPDLGIGAAFRL